MVFVCIKNIFSVRIRCSSTRQNYLSFLVRIRLCSLIRNENGKLYNIDFISYQIFLALKTDHDSRVCFIIFVFVVELVHQDPQNRCFKCRVLAEAKYFNAYYIGEIKRDAEYDSCNDSAKLLQNYTSQAGRLNTFS